MVVDPLNLLFINKECQDLQPLNSDPTVVPTPRPLPSEGPNVHRRKNDTAFPLETREVEECFSD